MTSPAVGPRVWEMIAFKAFNAKFSVKKRAFVTLSSKEIFWKVSDIFRRLSHRPERITRIKNKEAAFQQQRLAMHSAPITYKIYGNRPEALFEVLCKLSSGLY